MESAKSFEEKLQRIYKATKTTGPAGLAKALGIKSQSISAASKRQQIPTGWIEKVAIDYSVRSDWLFFGEGPMHREDLRQAPPDKDTHHSSQLSPPRTEGEDLEYLRQENRELRKGLLELSKENVELSKEKLTLVEQNAELRLELQALKLKPDKRDDAHEDALRRSA